MPTKRNLVQNVPGIVVHGTTAGTTRPPNQAVVIWIGTVAPTNKLADDIWVNPNGTTSATTTPTGPAGGDLTGTYPNPSIGNGVIDESNLAVGTQIPDSMLVNPFQHVAALEGPPLVPAWYAPVCKKKSSDAGQAQGDVELTAGNAVQRYTHLTLSPSAQPGYFLPMSLPAGVYDSVGILVRTAAATANVEFAFYAADGTYLSAGGAPGTRLAVTSASTALALGWMYSTGLSYTHPGGFVWLGCYISGTGTPVVMKCQPIQHFAILTSDGSPSALAEGQLTTSGFYSLNLPFSTNATAAVAGQAQDVPFLMVHRDS